jgi:hypothetical protein
MRWTDETGRHEGFLAAILPDGGEAPPLDDGRTIWWAYNGADGPRAIGVKGACQCGWRGTETHPIDFGDDEATIGAEERTGPYADWEYHVEQAEGAIPRDVEQLLATLAKRVEELSAERNLTALRVVAAMEKTTAATTINAVRAARRNLCSWEGIGRALGRSRQAAHERFSRYVDTHESGKDWE